MDFVSDWVVGLQQKQVRIINIMDEGSRRALWTEAHQSISAKKLIQILEHVMEYRGKPAYIRCDNGPEFISQKLELWADSHDIELGRAFGRDAFGIARTRRLDDLSFAT